MKKTRKLLSLLITFSMVLSFCTVFGGMISFGAAPIEIDTADKLRLIGRDAAYPMDGNYVLTADIDLSAQEWIPIGITSVSDTDEVYFKGTFDGQGHVISGMHSGTDSAPVATTANGWGLFSWIENATIKNVAFKDVYFNVGINASNTNMALGTVCGLIAGTSTIENVAVLSGTIQDVISTHQTRVAGIAGAFTGSAGIVIKNCFNAADIVAKHSRDNKGSYAIAAGILGNPKNVAGNSIVNCFNMGKISSTGAYTGTTPTNQSFTGSVFTFAGKDSAAINTTLTNLVSLEGLLTNAGSSVSYSKDAAATTLVSAEAAKSSVSFRMLTAVEDGSVWVCEDGKYPMLKTFASYAIAVPGAETDAGVIRIATADQLRLIGRDDAYPLNGNYKLVADINLGDKEWVPISSDNENGFTGTFDGNGHVISNLFIGSVETAKEISDTMPHSYGLFSYLGENASVSNLLFKNICININVSGRTNLALGAVAGYSKYSNWKISNVVVLSGLLSASNQRQNRVGGILGCCHGNTNGATIENCYNGASIVSSFTNTSGNCYAGAAGIVGFTNGKNLIVKNCLNVGSISTPVSGNGNNRGSIGNIVAFPSTSASLKTELAEGSSVVNSFAIAGLLSYDTESSFTSHFAADKSSVTLVSGENTLLASSYQGLTAVDEGNVWVCKDGKYPMLKLFADFAATAAAGGTTTPDPDPDPTPDPDPDKPIEINNEEELRKIGVDDAYPLDGNYILMADINMTNSPDWAGIGGGAGFSGTFDGQGHVIIGMHAGAADRVYSLAHTHAWGLFNILLSGAKVKNIAFKDVYYNGLCTSTNTAVGVVGGYTNQNGVEIENVAVLSGTLKGNCARQTRVGGILGVSRASEGTLIKNCFNAADLYADYGSSGNRYVSVGGIVGKYECKDTEIGIVNCVNVGKITALKTASGGTQYGSIGAIIANASTNSAPYGDVTTIVNCFALRDCLVYDKDAVELIGRNASDANLSKVKEVLSAVAGMSLVYGDLTSASDAWVAKDGYYPMLKIFESYAIAAPSGDDVESYLIGVLKDLYIDNSMTQEKVSDAVKEALGGGFTVTSCILEMSKATSSANGSYKITVAFTDGKNNYSVVHSGILALPKIEYNFATDLVGRAEGTITVTDLSYTVNASYGLYWGTKDGLLKGYSYLALGKGSSGDLQLTDAAKGIMTYKVPDSVMIPEGATHLWLTLEGTPVASYEIAASRQMKAETPQYIFGMVSDVHFGSNQAPAAFKAAMDMYQSAQASFVVICGDITENGTAAQYKIYTDLYAANKYTLPVWVTLGNHDILAWNLKANATPKQALANVKAAFPNFANAAASNDIFKVVVGDTEKSPGCENDQMDYTMAYGDDLFVFLCVGPEQYPNETYSSKQPEKLDQNQIDWLDGVLNNYYNVEKKNGQVFLVFHYYVNEAGMQMAPGYGVWDAASSTMLHNVLVKYPGLIHFTGHNHFAFDDDENIYDDSYTAIHVPTLSKAATDVFEGYIVERYADYILVKGYDFGSDQYIPHAMFMISCDNENVPENPENPEVPPTSDLAIHGLVIAAMVSLAVGAVVVLKKRRA